VSLFKESKSVKNALQNKNLEEAKEILEEIVKNKPEKNKWSGQDKETSNRAFYHTGG
jgi:cyclic pyranopterin phosphate synthase